MCVCLDFLKPKTRINKKVGNKIRLAEPKTQLFKKSCVLDSGKIDVQNALHLWTSEVHKWKRVAGRFWIITVGMCIYENVPHTDSHRLTNSSVLSQWPSSLCSSRRTPSPPRLPALLDFYALLCALLRGKLLPLLLLSFFVFFNAILIFFFFF